MLLNPFSSRLSDSAHRTGRLVDSNIGKQGKRVAELLSGFDFEGCEAWKALKTALGAGIRHRELYSVAQVLASTFGFPPPSRDAQRSMAVLIKWFQTNWSAIEPILPSVHILDADLNLINEAREVSEHGDQRTRV
jgi:hypothetical protein